MKLTPEQLAQAKNVFSINVKDRLSGEVTDTLVFRYPVREDMHKFNEVGQRGDYWAATELLCRLCCVSHEVAEFDLIADQHTSVYTTAVKQLLKSDDTELVATKKG